jgi:hypothetical protein
MLEVALVGRAVRLYGAWFALCSFCGGCVKLTPSARYGGEICCLRCDDEMLGLASAEDAAALASTRGVCRYCGKTCPDVIAARWKQVKAPLDVAGRNARLPPPLRTVFYCLSHFRAWVPAAHRVLATRFILSHIAFGAKPVFGGDLTGKRTLEEIDLGLGIEVKPKKKKRKAKPKKAAKVKADVTGA